MEANMKVIGTALVMACMLPGYLHADPAVTNQNDQECYVYFENLLGENTDQIVYTLLDLDPFSPNKDAENVWQYYIVHSNQTKDRLLNAFLAELQHYHRHSKLPFSAVVKYWEEAFNIPIQIYVFEKDDGNQYDFCTSLVCENIIAMARILDLGFIWNGALSIAEEDIKSILNAPAEYKLITTIFLNRTESSEVSRLRQ
jgi:hypothetical protein